MLKERAWLSNLKTIVKSVRVKAGGVNIARRGKYSKINLKLLSLRKRLKLKIFGYRTQQYGWREHYDNFNLGNSRIAVCKRNFFNPGHLS